MTEDTGAPHLPTVADARGCAPPARRPGPDFTREQAVSEAFVSLVSSLTEGHDILEIYSRLTVRCTELLDVTDAGLLLADSAGVLHVMAASSEHARDLECFQVQCAQGPCLDSYRTGATVLVPDLAAARTLWPTFATVAVEAGFAAVHAVPMRLGSTVLGSLNLFHTRPGPLGAADLHLAQAFAYTASAALVAGRAVADKTLLAEQLQTALNSRVILEQAKGILAQLGDLDMAHAFAALRRYARDHNRPLTDISAAVVTRDLLARLVLEHARSKGLLGTPRPSTARADGPPSPSSPPPSRTTDVVRPRPPHPAGAQQ